tara:strand:+ start:71 stop:235 length:165 start_codon:yes stop_codon:yes gene_type:complete
MYYLIENNGKNVTPRFQVEGVFKTFKEGKEEYYKLKEEAKKRGWTRNYILTKSL